MSAGKGDTPRSCFSKKFRENYEAITWGDEDADHPNKKFIGFECSNPNCCVKKSRGKKKCDK